ncbi:expressed unknown protein [Seminavis robusta]|uniref:Uncharacterized protein n=1 Tax=Seminavis robusta TaxID=568900 RepID=A0A9N8EKF9_9STRA|nr:expressed unknown protein [Seminavis robusta]|eukprot:Sro1334_g263780.1 n/a (116) ;mRNA; r:10826-11173
MTLQETVLKLLTTKKVDLDKVRRRRRRRRRREAAKQRAVERFEAWVIENSTNPKYAKKRVLPSLDDDTESTQQMSGHFQDAQVVVDENTPPFVGKVQETCTPVRVKSHYEWYDLY